jgi:hypothetical protein
MLGHAALLPSELIELDSELEFSAASLVIQVASRLVLVTLPDAPSATPDLEVISKRIKVCKLQPIQVQKSSLTLTTIEQRAMPVMQKNRRSYFMEILWFIFLFMGPTGLLWSDEVQHDVNLAKSAFLMKFH